MDSTGTEKRLCTITVLGTPHTYPEGTPFLKLAEDCQKDYPSQILLVNLDGKLTELNKPIVKDGNAELLTSHDRPAHLTYERSAELLMLKAFYDTLGRKSIRRIIIDHSVGRALFCRAEGDFELTDELLQGVEAAMRKMVDLKLPIRKKMVRTDEAIESFRRHGMHDKVHLFRFRRSSWVHMYELAGFEDYFYGYMVPDCSYIQQFRLQKFMDGFVLRLPTSDDPSTIPEFHPSMKTFAALRESTTSAERLGLDTVGGLNECIASGGTQEMILMQEAIMEKQIGDIAQEIADRGGVRFVMIAGPSSSGKTTTSNRLCAQLRALGYRPFPVEVDNYFHSRDKTPKDADGNYDFECIGALDTEQFNEDMSRLLKGETVEIPKFNFRTGTREYNGNYLKLEKNDILVIEGIHCLNDAMSYSLPAESKYKIYVSCLTQMNIDEHNRFPTSDARLLRRIVRDARTRGYDARSTLARWPSVNRGEHVNIFPYQDSADAIFNSALIYETAVMKPYVEALLFGVPRGCHEYVEAKRLLKFLDYFLAVPSDIIPLTSICREFIGGGIYKV